METLRLCRSHVASSNLEKIFNLASFIVFSHVEKADAVRKNPKLEFLI